MHPFDEMKAYVGFGPADSAELRGMAALVVPHLDELVERFYAVALRFEGPVRVLTGPEQIARLGDTLRRWARELFEGPHDHAYFERRRRIGEVHVRVGLPQQYMFTAMNIVRRALLTIYERESGGPVTPAQRDALLRMTDLELAIMLESYGAETRASEMRELRDALVRNLPINALLLDAEGRVAAATDVATQHYAGERPGGLRGLSYTEILPAELIEAVDLPACLRRALEVGSEVVVPRVDCEVEGRSLSLLVSVVPIRHEVARTLVHVEDLTQAISSEARAQQAEALAQIGTMAARVAHEIRNPLAGMSGTMQVLVASLPHSDRRRSVITKVMEQIERLNGMVGDLLQFSKPVTAQCADLDLHALAARVASQVAAAGLGRTEVAGAGHGQADDALLFHALLNLVQNGWQAGSTRVLVEVGPRLLTVLDDGPGIDLVDVERIFQPFFTTRHRGTGLGLPNSVRCIEAMGGSLVSVSSPLGGAGFRIRLPEPFSASDRTSPSGSAAHIG